MNNSQQYCAFISYRHLMPDMAIAKALHTAIETYHIPVSIQKKTGRKKMGRVFRDQEELPLSSDLGADIEEALDRSEWFIAICSPKYPDSRWCMRELEYFIERRGIDHVLTILVAGEPEQSIPEILRYREKTAGEYVKMEPLAADVKAWSLSESLKKLKNEKLRLLAPMLSAGYDDLRRRARKRRIRIIVSAIAAVLAVTAAISTVVTVGQRRAEKLRQEADEQRLLAVTQSINADIQKALASMEDGDRITAASTLHSALSLSQSNGNVRDNEILSYLRKAVYISPFTPVATLNGLSMPTTLTDLTVSPDEKYCIGIENGNTIIAANLSLRLMPLYRATADNTEISYIEYSPDGEHFLAICRNGRCVQVWNAKDGSPAFSCTAENDGAGRIAHAHFMADGSSLLVQERDTFRVVSEKGESRLFYTLGEQQDGYDPDYNVYTAFDGGSAISDYIDQEFMDYTEMDVVLSPDRTRVLISGLNGQTGTIILDENGKRVCLLQWMPATYAEKYTFSPDGRLVSAISKNRFLATWDAETGERLYAYTVSEEVGRKTARIAYSPDSSRFAYIYEDKLEVWDARTAETLAAQNFTGERYDNHPSLVYSKDGAYIFACYEHMYFLDARDCHPLNILTGSAVNPYRYCTPLKHTVFITHAGIDMKFYSMPSISSVSFTDSFDGELWKPFDAAKPTKEWSYVPEGEHQTNENTLSVFANHQLDTTPALFYSEDGETAAITYPDGAIEIFRRDGNGSPDAVIKPFSAAFWQQYSTAVAMNGTFLVTSGMGQLVIYYMGSHTVRMNTHNDHYYEKFTFSWLGAHFMAMVIDGAGIDVYRSNGEELFTMGPNEVFTDFGFTKDGAYAVGKTNRGYVIGDMFLDDEDVVKRSSLLALCLAPSFS